MCLGAAAYHDCLVRVRRFAPLSTQAAATKVSATVEAAKASTTRITLSPARSPGTGLRGGISGRRLVRANPS